MYSRKKERVVFDLHLGWVALLDDYCHRTGTNRHDALRRWLWSNRPAGVDRLEDMEKLANDEPLDELSNG